MALLVFTDGSRRIVKPETGAYVWRVINGEIKAKDEKWARFCSKVRGVYLNPLNAPQSYLDRFPERRLDNDPVVVVQPKKETWVPIETRRDLI